MKTPYPRSLYGVLNGNYAICTNFIFIIQVNKYISFFAYPLVSRVSIVSGNKKILKENHYIKTNNKHAER